jgi:alkaline phosphatase
MVADLHYALHEMRINRYYWESLDKLKEAIEIFNKSRLDFIVELGDLKDQGDLPEKNQTLRFLDEAERELEKFRGPVYHVLGNHDMDSISKSDFLQHIKNPNSTGSRAFYSFMAKGIKFIILDANFNDDGGTYDCGNFDWTVAIIPKKQIAWLKKELDCTHPVVIFVHQMLDSFSGINKDLCIKNAPEIVEII